MFQTVCRGMMISRFTAHVMIFGISYFETIESSRFVFNNNFGRVSLLRRNSLLSATTTSNQASLSTKTATLDLSDWFPQQQQEEEDENTILVSVRTRRRPSLLKDNKEDTTTTPNNEETIDPVILESVTKPFVQKSIWSRLKGNEYDQPGVIDDLVETALFMTKLEDSEWIKWEA